MSDRHVGGGGGRDWARRGYFAAVGAVVVAAGVAAAAYVTFLSPDGTVHPLELAIIVSGVTLTLAILALLYRQVARPMAHHLDEVATAKARAEHTYTELFEGNPVAMIVADVPNRKITQANAAACRMFGYSAEEFATLSRDDVVPPHPDRAAHIEPASPDRPATAMRAGPLDLRRKDGSTFRGVITGDQLDLGGTTAWFWMVEDVTEKEAIEHRLETAQRSYADLFEGSPFPLLVLDARSLEILDANGAFVNALGYSRAELRSMRTPDLTVVESEDEAARLHRVRASMSPTVRFGPVGYRRKGGSVMRAVATSYVVDYETRKIRVATLEDVTEKEKIERQMQQAQRLESLGQLAGGVAHDFNNLLTVILNVTSSLKSSVVDGETARDVDRIDKAAKTASRLTHQLLAFARREVVSQTVLNVGDEVADLKELLSRTIGSHIALTMDLPRDVSPVLMERGQLEQIVINVAVNSRDAMPRGGRLAIRAQNVEVDDAYAATRPGLSAGSYVELEIADSGTGMDRATLEHVFEPFFTTKPAGQGTGLGLATVYGIVKQVNGHIGIYSEPGRGTTVKVLIPRTNQQPQAEPPPAAADARPGSGTILVVEDYPDLRELFQELLTDAGYRVLTAPDGVAAITVARQHEGEIDLVLTDIVMPNMLGTDLARELRERQPRLRVVFMSGHAQPVIGAATPLPPGARLLQKPFMAADLLGKVRESLAAPAVDEVPA